MLIVHRTALRRRSRTFILTCRAYHAAKPKQQKTHDPRLSGLDHVIDDEFAALREKYQCPKYPIILAHGLLGFDQLRPIGSMFPPIHYWRGITEALAAKGINVITAEVPPSGRIEVRAKRLAEVIERKAEGKAVNIIAGLDSRYMISQLHPANVRVLSLTTIATPHHGSTFADFMFKQIGPTNIPKLYKILDFFGLETGAFRQLTKEYMDNKFNPRTPNVEGVKYYSYGARMQPHLLSVFRHSHGIVEKSEGPNDGLVSVASSQWGTYKGTLDEVSHLDLINWTNRMRWYFWSLSGYKRKFNAIAFYLDIADTLAKEGF